MPSAYVVETAGLKGRRILVVDDNRDDQLLIRLAMEEAGAATSLAASAFDAIRSAKHGEFDGAIVDISLGGSSGTELLEVFIEQGTILPVVCVSGVAKYTDG